MINNSINPLSSDRPSILKPPNDHTPPHSLQICIQRALSSTTDISSQIDQIENIHRFIPSQGPEKHKKRLLESIAVIPPDQRPNVVAHTLSLITPHTSSRGRLLILNGIAAIPQDQRESVMAHIFSLRTPDMNEKDTLDLFKLIATMPQDQRENVMAHVLSLRTPDMNEKDTLDLFKLIAAIPQDQRENVIVHTLSLKMPHITSNGTLSILKGIIAIPQDERANVVAYVQSLRTPNISGKYISSFLERIAAIQIDLRAQVVGLLTQDMCLVSNAYILDAIVTIAPDLRPSVIALLNPDMPLHSNIKILDAIIAIAPHLRPSMIALLTPEMGATHIASLLHYILANEADLSLLALTISCVTREMSADEKIYVFREIKSIPPLQRTNMIAAVLPLFAPDMDGFMRYNIIRAIKGISANERDRVIERIFVADLPLPMIARIEAAKWEGPRGEIHDLRQQAALGINVHADNRDIRTGEAMQLLRAEQGPIDTPRLMEAKEEFVAFIRASHRSEKDKQRALDALEGLPRQRSESFGPLIDGQNFGLIVTTTTGIEVIGRFWIFASQLSEKDAINTKAGMLSALVNSYEGSTRVCNQGKTQRLATAVLQGNLPGVNIEGGVMENVLLPTNQVVTIFFNNEANQRIDNLAELLNAANRFCDENARVNRAEFITQIILYAENSEIV